jgi:sugar phosphate isomerase/epimerase
MIHRRQFLTNTALAAAGSLVAGCDLLAASAYNKKQMGLQLYSLRDEISGSGLPAVLKKIKAAGYTNVEFYGYDAASQYFKHTPAGVAQMLKDNGLISKSSHCMMNLLDKDGQKAIDAAKTIGNEYLVIPWLLPEMRKNIDDYKRLAEYMNKAAVLCKKNKLKLAYHNHEFEFEKFGGEVSGYDVLLNDCDKKLIDFEMDLYWIVYAGLDPVELFKQNPGRFKMWHVKDMDKNDRTKNAAIGAGSINFKPVFENAAISGLQYFYVEQETFSTPTDEAIRDSVKFIRKNLIK